MQVATAEVLSGLDMAAVVVAGEVQTVGIDIVHIQRGVVGWLGGAWIEASLEGKHGSWPMWKTALVTT